MNRIPAKVSLEIGNLNVLGNGYLEDPKRWQVVASWV
jgi:hypothetical protein